jgi:hypothetical protein
VYIWVHPGTWGAGTPACFAGIDHGVIRTTPQLSIPGRQRFAVLGTNSVFCFVQHTNQSAVTLLIHWEGDRGGGAGRPSSQKRHPRF